MYINKLGHCVIRKFAESVCKMVPDVRIQGIQVFLCAFVVGFEIIFDISLRHPFMLSVLLAPDSRKRMLSIPFCTKLWKMDLNAV